MFVVETLVAHPAKPIADEVTKDTIKPVRWLIEGMLPEGHKGMIASPEGGCKTTILAWIAVCVALGKPVFGMPTKQGAVVMIDEETPVESLKRKLNRFCLGLGLKGLEDVPNLTVLSKKGFRFDRTNPDVMAKIAEMKPALITIDTLLACFPSGRQGFDENNSKTGIAVRDALDQMLKVTLGSSVLIAAHSGKAIDGYEIEDYHKAEMPKLVRGHGSITGEACDTGYGLLKISERPSLRFALVTKARREAIPMGEVFVEMKEEAYGEGWARLEKIAPVPTPPSVAAVALFSIFRNVASSIEARTIKGTASALYTPSEIRLGLEQLRRRKVILTAGDYFTFKLNPKLEEEADEQYLGQLKATENASKTQAQGGVE